MSDALEKYSNPINATPADFKKSGVKLMMQCRCGTKKQFDVGRILLDPEYLDIVQRRAKSKESSDPSPKMEDYVYFSGYLRCKKCGASSDWTLTYMASFTLHGLLLDFKFRPKDARIHIGKLQLFDGTPCRNGAQAEDYIRGLLEKSPHDAFLWTRLANVFESAEMPSKCLEAHRKALECDPTVVESNYMVGRNLAQKGKWKKAGLHLHNVLRFARSSWLKERSRALLNNLVDCALQDLLDVHEESNGEVEPIAPFDFAEKDAAVGSGEPVEPSPFLFLTEIDLGNPKDREMMRDTYIDGRIPEWKRKEMISRQPRKARQMIREEERRAARRKG